MRNHIEYKYVQPGTVDFQRMQTFAESFDHKIIPHPKINVYSFNRNDICFGYIDVVYIPVMYPAFHPELTKPKDVLDSYADFRAHAALSGNPLHLGVPLEKDRPNFPNSTMAKIGFQPMGRELFTI
jgi:hypothetical protein